MTIAAQIKSVSSNLEISTKAAEFGAVARVFMASRGDGKLAAEMARAQGLGARVADVVMKTPVAAMSMTSATALSEYGDVIAAFLGSLSSAGAFDAMLPNMRKVNPHVRLVSITASATAYIAGEGGARPLTSLALEGHQLAEYEAAAILVELAELLRGALPDTARWFRDDLTRATALVTDQKFISLVTSGLTAITSAGATSNQILQDITRRRCHQHRRIVEGLCAVAAGHHESNGDENDSFDRHVGIPDIDHQRWHAGGCYLCSNRMPSATAPWSGSTPTRSLLRPVISAWRC